ncbi:MAG: phasin family protein [Lautropia sp.]
MARKDSPKQESDPKAPDKQMAEAVRESTHQIWLAGLGAFAKAQLEGTKMFESLVREGSDLQRRTLAVAENRLGEVTGRVAKVAGEFSRQATGSWDKLEQVFEDRVARALSRLGVPSGRDIQELTDLLNQLNSKVAALGKAGNTRRAAGTQKAATATGLTADESASGSAGTEGAKGTRGLRGTKGTKIVNTTSPKLPAKSGRSTKARKAAPKTAAEANQPSQERAAKRPARVKAADGQETSS